MSRIHQQHARLPVKLELSSIDSHEDEEDDGDGDGEGDDDVIMSDEQGHHVLRSLHYNDDKARSDQVKGYLTGDAQDDKIIPIVRSVGTASKPARVSKVSVSVRQPLCGPRAYFRVLASIPLASVEKRLDRQAQGTESVLLRVGLDVLIRR